MHIRQAAAWAIAAQYCAFALQFISSLILARYFIAPAQLGTFSIAFAAVSLIAFLQDFGIGRYVTGERSMNEEQLRTAFTISLIVGWTIAVLSVALAWPLASWYADSQLIDITLVIAASYFLVPLAILPQAMRQRELDFRSSALIDISAALANAVVSIYFAWKGHGAMALAWGAFAQQLARLLVAQWRAGWVLPWPPRLVGSGTLLSLGATNTVLVACQLLLARAPELIIGRLFGSTPVGLFARAGGLALQLRMLLAGAVNGVFYPAFRQVRDRGDQLSPPYLRLLATYGAITWPALAGLAVLAEPTIRLLYGENWMGSAPLLIWIALAQMCFVSAPMNADLPILLGRKRELIFRNILDLMVGLALLALAVPYGLEAIAASRFIHGLLWVANFSSLLRRVVGFTWREWADVQARTLVATLLAVLPTLIFYAYWDGPQTAGFVQIIASAGTGAMIWLVGLRQLRHPAYEEIVAMVRLIMVQFRARPT